MRPRLLLATIALSVPTGVALAGVAFSIDPVVPAAGSPVVIERTTVKRETVVVAPTETPRPTQTPGTPPPYRSPTPTRTATAVWMDRQGYGGMQTQ